MFCNMCGKNLADDAKFCIGCGAKTRLAITERPPVPEYIRAEERFCNICGGVYPRYQGKCPHCNHISAKPVHKTQPSVRTMKREPFNTIKKRVCSSCNELNAMFNSACQKCGKAFTMNEEIVEIQEAYKNFSKADLSFGAKLWFGLIAFINIFVAIFNLIELVPILFTHTEQTIPLIISTAMGIAVFVLILLIMTEPKRKYIYTYMLLVIAGLLLDLITIKSGDIGLYGEHQSMSVVLIISRLINIGISWLCIKKQWDNME